MRNLFKVCLIAGVLSAPLLGRAQDQNPAPAKEETQPTPKPVAEEATPVAPSPEGAKAEPVKEAPASPEKNDAVLKESVPPAAVTTNQALKANIPSAAPVTSDPSVTTTTAQPASAEVQKPEVKLAMASPRSKPDDANANYKLRVGDTLQFRIAEDPAAAVQPEIMTVSALGQLGVHVTRESDLTLWVKAEGKTVEEIRGEIKTKLDAEYYKSATVELELKDVTPRMSEVLLIGAVRANSIKFPPGEPKSIFEAILQAGYTEFANLKKVKLFRVNKETGKTETRIINVEAIKKTGDHTKDVPLQAGDRIEVPERSIVF